MSSLWSSGLAAAGAIALSGCSAWVDYRPGSARMVCQLTGEASINRTETRALVRGTDLGISFTGPFGSTFFLFGDTTGHPSAAAGADSIAWADHLPGSVNEDGCFHLTFFAWRGINVAPQVVQSNRPWTYYPGIFETPSGGFYSDGSPYVLYTIDARKDPDGELRPHGAILTRGSTLFLDANSDIPLKRLFAFPGGKFINVYALRVNEAHRPVFTTLVREHTVLFFGSGKYRKSSDIFLAKLDFADLADLERLTSEQERAGRLRYFAGVTRSPAGATQVAWSPDETQAVSVFARPATDCIGEFSVTWNLFLEKWLMLYNCGEPRGINYRVADDPWGPYSDPRVLFRPGNAPGEDRGYCHFIHYVKLDPNWGDCEPGTPNPGDNLVDRSGRNAIGGEYAPYIVHELTTGDASVRSSTIRYLMSTWNPYQVFLMEATLDTICPRFSVTPPDRCKPP